MNRFKSIQVILILILILFNLNTLSCSTELRYTAEEWKQREEQQVYVEKQKRINDYRERLRKWRVLRNDGVRLYDKHIKFINDLIEKNINENNTDKQIVYCELIADEYKQWFDDYSILKVPNFAKEFYEFELEYLLKEYEVWSYLSEGPKNFEENKANSLSSEAELLKIKAVKEKERIEQNFIEEAEDLDLAKPIF